MNNIRLIKPSVEYWQQDDIYEHIRRCAQVCYQSENDNSNAKAWVYRVLLKPTFSGRIDIRRSHLSPLAHGTVYLKASLDKCSESSILYESYKEFYDKNPFSRVVDVPINGVRTLFITTNLRVIMENRRLKDLKYLCRPTDFHHKRYTFSCITGIDVTRELNRHACSLSICEQSTRYCNFSKNKFDNKVTFVIPSAMNQIEDGEYIIDSHNEITRKIDNDEFIKCYNDDNKTFLFIHSLVSANNYYMRLIEDGLDTNNARKVLPLATKSQVVYTGFLDDWVHVLLYRKFGIAGTPHPDAKFIADMIYDKLCGIAGSKFQNMCLNRLAYI
jgi:thymidylate synthase (FAD)